MTLSWLIATACLALNAQAQTSTSPATDCARPPHEKGSKPPEPPKDANGNPLPPPTGSSSAVRREPPKDANGNPLPPPCGPRREAGGNSTSSSGNIGKMTGNAQ